jgi:NADH:ubiquinone oxidoreductase subunit 4 (subunit M)
MLILLLILFPLLGGILIWFAVPISWHLSRHCFVSIVVMVLSLVVYNQYHHGLHEELIYQQPWISQLGANVLNRNQ